MIIFSIVIPTYNRVEQLGLTLASFEVQTYPLEQYELIVVDDGSTDKTRTFLEKYKNKSPNRLSYISTKRKGPANARNVGIKLAKGKYIIFCDADFIVTPNFIETHDKYHLENENSVVSGTPNSFTGIYTVYYPSFSTQEKEALKSTLEKNNLWKAEYLKDKSIKNIITSKDIIENFNKIYDLIWPWNIVSDELNEAFLNLDIAPWLLFITRNVSVEREKLLEVKGFDERLMRGAGEDWDLGYRLHLLGLSFVSIKETIGFHQEHPQSFRKPFKSFTPFGYTFSKKYGTKDPEILLLSIWDNSDRFWGYIPSYKKALRIINSDNQSTDIEGLISYLNKSLHYPLDNNNIFKSK